MPSDPGPDSIAEAGHALGDQVLIQFADAIRSQVPAGAIAGRFGGEEFVLFVPNVDDRDATGIAKSIVPASFGGMNVVGFVLGVAQVDVPFVELGIALSSVVIGGAATLGRPMPVGVSTSTRRERLDLDTMSRNVDEMSRSMTPPRTPVTQAFHDELQHR